jgi:hypothetical protein
MDLNSVIISSQKKLLQEIIQDIENFQLPPDWRGVDVKRFIINKLAQREAKL